ncbi:MAG: amino acid ABC transporter substrate-binding protein [Pseudomonas sp. PGPPP3]|nr:MAG: amino acid ABC transporter substrate-binding protein [Pseudomonas sp. PGPPP3]
MRYLMLCLSLVLSTTTVAETWRVIGDEQFAPYSFVQGDDNTPRGLDVELVSAILAEAKIDYQLRLYPWARVKRLLDTGAAEMAFQFAGTPERQAQYELVGPIRSGSTVFMTTRKIALQNWHSLDELQPYVIGQVRGYAYESAFDQADLSRDISAQNPRHYVHEQRADDNVHIMPNPLVEMPRYVAFKKGDSDRAGAFAAALKRLQQRDALTPILQRWQ